MYQVKLTPAASVDVPEPVVGQASTATTATSTEISNEDSKSVVKSKGAFQRAQTIVALDLSAAETDRLKEDIQQKANWKRWGPFLSERQWATVREDYSPHGSW